MTVIAQDYHLTAGAWAACGDIDFFFFFRTDFYKWYHSQ